MALPHWVLSLQGPRVRSPLTLVAAKRCLPECQARWVSLACAQVTPEVGISLGEGVLGRGRGLRSVMKLLCDPGKPLGGPCARRAGGHLTLINLRGEERGFPGKGSPLE